MPVGPRPFCVVFAGFPCGVLSFLECLLVSATIKHVRLVNCPVRALDQGAGMLNYSTGTVKTDFNFYPLEAQESKCFFFFLH